MYLILIIAGEITDAPQFTMGLCPDKPIAIWKYPKLKMRLLYLTLWIA
jgi:hypothetical protein